jgi:hypothetical protein
MCAHVPDFQEQDTCKVLVSRGKWSQEFYPSVFDGELK